MSSYEIMLSEKSGKNANYFKKRFRKKQKKFLKKWDLDFSIIGKITNTKNII